MLNIKKKIMIILVLLISLSFQKLYINAVFEFEGPPQDSGLALLDTYLSFQYNDNYINDPYVNHTYNSAIVNVYMKDPYFGGYYEIEDQELYVYIDYRDRPGYYKVDGMIALEEFNELQNDASGVWIVYEQGPIGAPILSLRSKENRSNFIYSNSYLGNSDAYISAIRSVANNYFCAQKTKALFAEETTKRNGLFYVQPINSNNLNLAEELFVYNDTGIFNGYQYNFGYNGVFTSDLVNVHTSYIDFDFSFDQLNQPTDTISSLVFIDAMNFYNNDEIN